MTTPLTDERLAEIEALLTPVQGNAWDWSAQQRKKLEAFPDLCAEVRRLRDEVSSLEKAARAAEASAKQAEARLCDEQRVLAAFKVLLKQAERERDWLAKELAELHDESLMLVDVAPEGSHRPPYWINAAREATMEKGE